MPGWQKLTNAPSFSVDTMLLLTDASIMCHEYETSNWHRLVPDTKGNYVNRDGCVGRKRCHRLPSGRNRVARPRDRFAPQLCSKMAVFLWLAANTM
jgi:hypothetical protein